MGERASDKIEQVPPYVIAMVTCDSIYVDPTTGKKSLLGVFSAVCARSFPVRIGQLCLYVAMTDGRGVTPFTIRLVDGEEERDPIFQMQGEIIFTDPRMVAELITGMVNIEFPEAGEYRLQFLACNTLLMERRIVIAGSPEAPDA